MMINKTIVIHLCLRSIIIVINFTPIIITTTMVILIKIIITLWRSVLPPWAAAHALSSSFCLNQFSWPRFICLKYHNCNRQKRLHHHLLLFQFLEYQRRKSRFDQSSQHHQHDYKIFQAPSPAARCRQSWCPSSSPSGRESRAHRVGREPLRISFKLVHLCWKYSEQKLPCL